MGSSISQISGVLQDVLKRPCMWLSLWLTSVKLYPARLVFLEISCRKLTSATAYPQNASLNCCNHGEPQRRNRSARSDRAHRQASP
jgi:hypothetical protein